MADLLHNKRKHTSFQIIILGFDGVILVGALLLMLPISAKSGVVWEGSYFPKIPNGKRKKFNVYAKTREECEFLLAEVIPKVKAEIQETKANLKASQTA